MIDPNHKSYSLNNPINYCILKNMLTIFQPIIHGQLYFHVYDNVQKTVLNIVGE